MLDEANIKQMLALYNAGRFADMESIARSVLPMAPNSPLLNELLGIALSAQNRNAEALNFLEAATRYAPRDPQFWENLGLCQQRIGEFTSAEASLRCALSLRPESSKRRSDLPVFCGQWDARKKRSEFTDSSPLRTDNIRKFSSILEMLC